MNMFRSGRDKGSSKSGFGVFAASGDVYSDEDDSNASRQSLHPRKKSKTTTNLTEAQEETMVEWLSDNHILYNRKCREYKDTAKKRTLWVKKADELGMEAEMLEVWYKSIRTRYGKLLAKKSGESQAQLTDRDKWILGKFKFLSGHIVSRCPKKTIVRLKEKISGQTRRQFRPTTEVDLVSDDDDSQVPYTQEQSTSQQLPCLRSTQTFKTSQGKPPLMGNKSKGNTYVAQEREEDDAFIQTMADRVESSSELHDQILSYVPEKATQNAQRTVFGDWMKQNMYYIHPNLWRKFQRDAFSLMMNYHDETDQLNTQRQPLSEQTSSQPVVQSSSQQHFTQPSPQSQWQPLFIQPLTNTSSPSDLVYKTEPSYTQ